MDLDVDSGGAPLPIALPRLRTDFDSLWAVFDLWVQNFGHFCTVLGV
jgi:hypothetical protein